MRAQDVTAFLERFEANDRGRLIEVSLRGRKKPLEFSSAEDARVLDPAQIVGLGATYAPEVEIPETAKVLKSGIYFASHESALEYLTRRQASTVPLFTTGRGISKRGTVLGRKATPIEELAKRSYIQPRGKSWRITKGPRKTDKALI